MKSLSDLKKEIERYTELQEIALALEQSSASYIVKVRKKMLASRPFFEEAWTTYNLYKKIVSDHDKRKSLSQSPAILTITPNQGMTGLLIWQVAEKTKEEYNKNKADLLVVGKKGERLFSNKTFSRIKYFDLPEELTFSNIEKIIEQVYLCSNLRVIYPKYLSAFEQTVSIKELSNKDEDKMEGMEDQKEEKSKVLNYKHYILDPDQLALEQYFDKSVIGLILYRYFIESILAYKAAQMLVMKRAYDNAREQLAIAKFQYSRNRQELIDSRLRELYASRDIISR